MNEKLSIETTTHPTGTPQNDSLETSRGSRARDTPPYVWTPPPPKTNTLGRVVDALTTLPEWHGVLAWDEHAHRTVFRALPPFPGAVLGQPLREQHLDQIRLWFESARGVVVPKLNIVHGVRIVARQNAFHPVREYLVRCEHDGVARLDTWLEDFCAVRPRSENHRRLVRAMARKWLLSAVARAMTPGCKVDTMLILEGPQGIGKSTALAALAGERFFCDSVIDLGAKETCQTVQGVWIYELPELDALLRSGVAAGKAFLTRACDRFRVAYGRSTETVPRSVVFCGTINHGGYLKDSTGNRRFWTVRCEGTIDVEGLRSVRDALWAEARDAFEAGEPWHLPPDLEALLGEEHADRLEVDPWDESLATWLRAREGRPFSMNELLEDALDLKAQSRNPRVTRRVSVMLERLGYAKKRVGARAERTYVYVLEAPEERDTLPAVSDPLLPLLETS